MFVNGYLPYTIRGTSNDFGKSSLRHSSVWSIMLHIEGWSLSMMFETFP